jgi:hypothetical protein
MPGHILGQGFGEPLPKEASKKPFGGTFLLGGSLYEKVPQIVPAFFRKGESQSFFHQFSQVCEIAPKRFRNVSSGFHGVEASWESPSS